MDVNVMSISAVRVDILSHEIPKAPGKFSLGLISGEMIE